MYPAKKNFADMKQSEKLVMIAKFYLCLICNYNDNFAAIANSFFSVYKDNTDDTQLFCDTLDTKQVFTRYLAVFAFYIILILLLSMNDKSNC